MKTNGFFWAMGVALCALSACSNEKDEPQVQRGENIGIEATISRLAQPSRATEVGNNGESAFSAGDHIGLFLPDAAAPVDFSYDGAKWSSTATCQWKNKTDHFTFYAFSPYQAVSTAAAVVMPDLSQQDGTRAKVAEQDFLTSKVTTHYGANNGVISFTGVSAFKHIYVLLDIKIKNANSGEQVVLQKLTLSGANLFTAHTYNFTAENSLLTAKGSAVNQLVLHPNKTITSEGVTFYCLVNPATLDDAAQLSIEFTRGGNTYKATTNALGTTFCSGNCHQYTFSLKQGELLLQGAEITDWVIENKGEHYLEEVPA